MPEPYIPNDRWSQKAKKEGYRARSVYKLSELDQRFHLLKLGMTVLDLGAAPGSWLQYTAPKVKEGKVIGLDLEAIEPVAPHVQTFQVDITNLQAVEEILKREGGETVDLILSDLAPKTSGIKDIDQFKSIELCRAVLALASIHLKPSGQCVLKVFRGADFDSFLKELKSTFKEVKMCEPKASRGRSKEVYLILTKK